MNGLEFGVIFDPDNNGSQLWEIVRSEDYGRPLPDDTIYPEMMTSISFPVLIQSLFLYK